MSINKLRGIFKSLDMVILTEIFIFANTPTYLYRRLRENATVQNLANKYSSAELIEWFEYATKKKRRLLKTLLCMYAIIVALTFKESHEMYSFLDRLDRYDIKWFKELKYIGLSYVKNTSGFSKVVTKPEMIITTEVV